MMLAMLLIMMTEQVNLYFIGHLNDADMLAAVGTGNSVINLFCLSILYGMNAALETFAS